MPETMLETAARFIDDGVYDGPGAVNPVDGTFEEVGPGLGVVRAFSHVWALQTSAGLTLFDTSIAGFGPIAVDALRNWATDPVDTIVYTHGHIDHVGGAGAFLADAEARGNPAPSIVAHENVPVRFDRYDMTNGYNTVINQRQFGTDSQFFSDWVQPATTFRDHLRLDIGDTAIDLHHDRGETDDHCWSWVPDRRAIFCGDLFTWVFPNAGNPQKVQRFAADWAVALRKMVALEPELLLPAHGLPIAGAARIASVLDNAATAIEGLIHDTVQLMNAGATLDEILPTVTVPSHLLELPYLRPVYDEPEFVVRNIWRMYGGWYDGNPARLKPPADEAVAVEVATLAGGPLGLAQRGADVAAAGDLRLACQLVEWAGQAAPTDPAVHEIRATVYRQRRSSELSLMARGIFGSAAATSKEVSGE